MLANKRRSWSLSSFRLSTPGRCPLLRGDPEFHALRELAQGSLPHLGEVPYFRSYDLRSTYPTRLSAGGVADEWVTQLLRQRDAKVFKKSSQMKLQMKREALQKLNRQANESSRSFDTERPN